jgi:ASC-1-like (ASCH) protein
LTYYYGELFLLGFCGEIFPLIEVQITDREKRIISQKFAFNYEELIEFKKEKIRYYNIYPLSRWYSRQAEIVDFPKNEKKLIKKFFQDWSWKDDSIFLKNKVPVWVKKLRHYNKCAFLNPRLKDYGFDRIKDSFTAFQEISMYLSNILVEQKEIAAVEDKFRIEQHGFDLKKSFRKEKNSGNKL